MSFAIVVVVKIFSRQRGERYFLKDAVTVVSVVVKRQCNLWLVTKDKNPDKHYVKSECNIIL